MTDWVVGAYLGVKTAQEIAEDLIMNTDTTAKAEAVRLLDVILEIQRKLGEARAGSLANMQRIRELEQEIVRLKGWGEEDRNDELDESVRGAFAHVPKDAPLKQNFCADCYELGVKSILQACGHVKGYESVKCRLCGTVVPVRHSDGSVELS